MSLVLACDPGANPGFALFDDQGALVGCDWRPEEYDAVEYDVFIIEDQHAATHLYRDGRRVRVSRKSQQTLSFTAGRLFERFRATYKYRVPANDWRRVLWPGAVRLPKKTVLARLKPAYGDAVEGMGKHAADVLEAIGIGKAWLAMTDAQRKRYLCK